MSQNLLSLHFNDADWAEIDTALAVSDRTPARRRGRAAP